MKFNIKCFNHIQLLIFKIKFIIFFFLNKPALYLAVEKNDIEMVKVLVESGKIYIAAPYIL